MGRVFEGEAAGIRLFGLGVMRVVHRFLTKQRWPMGGSYTSLVGWVNHRLLWWCPIRLIWVQDDETGECHRIYFGRWAPKC